MKGVLESTGALWRKAEREAYRAFHAQSRQHKSDHFLNFCITAHALRDFFLAEKRISSGSARDAYHLRWSSDPQLVAVGEIANLTKHFRLAHRKTGLPKAVKTRKLFQMPDKAADVYISDGGEITLVERPSRNILITTSDGTRYELWEFQIDVLDYWRAFLKAEGIRVRRQTVDRFLDRAPGA